MTARRRWRLGALAGGLALLLAACAKDAPQDALQPEGPIADKIDGLWDLVFILAVIVFVIVEGMLVVALVRFRHRKGHERKVKQIHGNTRLEVLWTIIPALLLAAMAVPTVGTIWEISREPTGNVLQVTVTGKQWWWDIEYPSLELRTANELHIPEDRPVYITLESVDVIHSFGVQKLAGTQDVIPGQSEFLTIEADHPGTFLGQCREYCGTSHGNMRFRVIAHTAADFDAWVEDQLAEAAAPSGDLAARGLDLFMQPQLCIQCHAIRGVEGAGSTFGPDLTHFGSRDTIVTTEENTPENLAAWLRDTFTVKPGSKMPDYGCEGESEPVVEECLTEEDIQALVAYLEGLE